MYFEARFIIVIDIKKNELLYALFSLFFLHVPYFFSLFFHCTTNVLTLNKKFPVEITVERTVTVL
jgi:hypothetical protein